MAEASLSKACYPHVQGLVTNHRADIVKYNGYAPKKNLYVYRELMRGIYLFETGKLENNIVRLSEEIDGTKDIVEMLISKKFKGEYLSDDECKEIRRIDKNTAFRKVHGHD